MRGLAVDRLLSGTAVALVLVGLSVANASETVNIDQRAIEAAIPALDTADVPPPSAADFGGPITASTNAAPSFADIVNDIPVPESANTPPPTVRDFAKETATSNLAAADQAIAEKLREMLGARTDRLIRVKTERTAAEAFYAARNFAPLWIENGVVSSRTKAAIARIRNADADGLDVSDYAIPDFSVVGEAMLAEAELKFTATILAYARHAQSGRVAPTRISQNIEMNPPVPEPASVLSQIADAKDIAKTLDQFNPPHAGFQALRRKLAESRGQSGKSDVIRIASGPVLKQGMKDDRVPQLRERLHVRGDNHDITYDASLAEAVKAVQRNAKMKPTGLLDPRTIDHMNGAKRTPDLELIVSNMERWRWLPRDLGKAHVMVNVPDYSVRVMRDGKTTFHTKIVVGKAITPTPMLTHVMDHIVVNPTWHVPPSIIYGEYLPALQQDPTVLSRMGLVVEQRRDGTVAIRQPPGERNALGRIKFAFPNKFLVYMHDTPDKNLFAHDKRAFSHGCMRVQYPEKYAEALLAIALPEQNYSAARITGMYGKAETTLKFANRIPIYLTYMNAYVDENDKLVVREDLYGYDGRVRIALKDDDRRFADSTPPTQTRATIEAQRASSRRYFDRQDSGDFFQRLFR